MLDLWRCGLRCSAVAAAWLTLGGSVTAQETTLPPGLPAALPDVSAWERSAGLVEIDDPESSIEYELYVDPERTGMYGVTHYRIRITDLERRRQEGISDNPKLQWNVDGRLMRRYECFPAVQAGRCDWRELRRDGEAYRRELGVILRIYSIHRRLLHARARDLLPGD